MISSLSASSAEVVAGAFADRQACDPGLGGGELDQRFLAEHPPNDKPSLRAIGERGHRRALELIKLQPFGAGADPKPSPPEQSASSTPISI